jgi:RNA polymerase sigma-70 factor, ECF subfamily
MRDGDSNVLSSVLDEFRRGDPAKFNDAFETLFHMYQHTVYSWVFRIVRNSSAAEDLTVETFWRIYRAHARFEPARGFEPWARTIATHAALDWLRAQRPETELLSDVASPSICDPAISEEIRRKTAEAVSRLPPTLRVAAVLAVVEELPHKEVAVALGISITAVKVRVFRALRLLRKDLQQQGITP